MRTGRVLIESMRLRRTGRPRTGLSPALGSAAAFCVMGRLFAAQGPVSAVRRGYPVPAQRQAALFSVLAALAASIAVARRVEFPCGRRARACAGIGLGLFVVPSALAACAQG